MSDPLRFGLIGTGWIGRFHAESLATRVRRRACRRGRSQLEAAQAIGAARAYADPYD